MKKYFSFILLLLSASLFAQNDNIMQIKQLEDSILINFDNMDNLKNDSISLILSHKNIKLFEQIFAYDETWEYPFNQLTNRVSILNSDDKLVRVFTWNIFFKDGTFKYFGLILHK